MLSFAAAAASFLADFLWKKPPNAELLRSDVDVEDLVAELCDAGRDDEVRSLELWELMEPSRSLALRSRRLPTVSTGYGPVNEVSYAKNMVY